MAEEIRYRGTFPGTPLGVAAVRGEVEAVARECGIDGLALGAVKLAVNEAVTNAVVHAYAQQEGRIAVTVGLTGEALTVTVTDTGGGLVPRADSPGLGVGLPLIAQLADHLDVHSGDEGTQIRMSFRR
jgi:serine/threonine-protein kinase RsbW/stage II sporulation protein AB (anti-sigma F factor)